MLYLDVPEGAVIAYDENVLFENTSTKLKIKLGSRDWKRTMDLARLSSFEYRRVCRAYCAH